MRDTSPETVYREFDVVRRGFMRYEPVFICYDGDTLRTYRTHLFFWSRLTAMRVSMLMRTTYNDGLYCGRTNTALAKEDYDAS